METDASGHEINMRRHYCTIFDKNYLAKGLVLYESLLKHSSEPFTLYVLGMDRETSAFICNTPGHFVVASEWMLPGMDEARINRSWQEYCWTCASNFTEYLFRELNLPEITYLDADCMAFADLAPVFDEIGSRSIAITPHRLIPSKRHLEVNGLFNVGFVHFKNTEAGRSCLSWWASQCRNRCSAQVGCGDQKYLDEFIPRYGAEVCAIENIGVNAGPWSIGNWTVAEGPCVDGLPLVLYHFHEYVHGLRLTNYELRPEDREFIYRPYVANVENALARIMEHSHSRSIEIGAQQPEYR